MLLHRSLGIFDGVKHDKSVVEWLEQWSLDANLARSDMLLVVVSQVKVGSVSGKITDENHLVSVF